MFTLRLSHLVPLYVGLNVGCQSGDPDLLLRTANAHRVTTVHPADSSLPFVLERGVGRETGPGSFSAIAAATGAADGSVLLNEAATCKLVRVDPMGDLQVPGFGGCGDGPGEMRRLKGLTVIGDSVLVLLSEEPTYRVFRLNGDEVGRGTTNDSLPVGTDLQAWVGLGGPRILVSLAIPPAVLRARPESGALSPVGLLDLGTRAFTPFDIRSPVAATQNIANFVSGPSVCALEPGGLVAVFNEWMPQLLLVDPRSGDVRYEVRIEGDYSPIELHAPMVGYRPHTLASTVACGDGLAVFWTREGEVADGRTRIRGGIVGAVDREGNVLGVERYTSRDTLLFARPVAVSRGRIAMVTNTFSAFPQLLYVRLPWRAPSALVTSEGRK